MFPSQNAVFINAVVCLQALSGSQQSWPPVLHPTHSRVNYAPLAELYARAENYVENGPSKITGLNVSGRHCRLARAVQQNLIVRSSAQRRSYRPHD